MAKIPADQTSTLAFERFEIQKDDMNYSEIRQHKKRFKNSEQNLFSIVLTFNHFWSKPVGSSWQMATLVLHNTVWLFYS